MPSSFGKRKPVVRQRPQPQPVQWLGFIRPSDGSAPAAQEAMDALYRITQAAPSKLSQARAIRAMQRSAV
jgi:hypothetical protein